MWMKQHVETSGPAGISLDVLLKLYLDDKSSKSDEKIRLSADNTVEDLEGYSSKIAEEVIMLAGKELVKKTKAEAEHGKVGIRTIRKEANDLIKKEGKVIPEDVAKGLEDQIQKMTDQFIALVDKHLEAKEKEIMTI